MKRKLIKYLVEKLYRPFLIRYLSRKRIYLYKGLQLIIPPGVFHPGFFFSTKLLLEFLKTKNLTNKTFLELGAGSGLISLQMARQGAVVTASDISTVVTDILKKNAIQNKLKVEVIHSDLFDHLSNRTFDYVIINPPYYPHNPVKEEEHAWFCGQDFEYFRKLFSQLGSHIHPETETYMILSEDCAIEKIRSIAVAEGFTMTAVYWKKIWWERNFIFSVKRKA